MNANHNYERQLEQIERLVRDGRRTGDPLLDDLGSSTPRANVHFQRDLEERLLNMLTQPEEKMTVLARTHEDKQELSQIPLTLAAAIMVLILLGVLVNSSQPASEGVTGAQIDLRETEVAIQATQTAIAQEQVRLGALMQPANNSFAYGGHVMDINNADTLIMMRNAGMSWIKIHVPDISDQRYPELEAAIRTAYLNGFSILISVADTPEALPSEDFVTRYTDFVRVLAYLEVDAIEVWTEPNIDRSWVTGEISGASYVDLLKPAYEAIKAANPNALVISGAPAPTGAEASFPGRVKNDDNWLREMVSAGGLDYLDCVGVHYNEGIVAPDQMSSDPRDNYYTRYFGGMLSTYREVINDQKPLCFTEIGYLTGDGLGDLPMPFSWARDTSAAEQAAWLAQAVEIAHQDGGVRLMIVWNVDFTAYGENPDAGFAIIRPDGTCLACEALRSVTVTGMPTPMLQPTQTVGAQCSVAFSAPSMVSIYVEPRLNAEVIAQVAPTWSAEVLEHQFVDEMSWYQVRVGANSASVVGWVPREVVLHVDACPMPTAINGAG